MEYKLISSKPANNIYVFQKYESWVKSLRGQEQMQKDFNLIYLNQVRKLLNQGKYKELNDICENLNLDEVNVNTVINFGRFLTFEDLKPQENLKSPDLDILFRFLKKLFFK